MGAAGPGPGYASPIVTVADGVRQLVTMTDKAVVGVDVRSGAQLWTIPFPDATPRPGRIR